MRILFSIITCALLACCAIHSPQAGPVGFRLSSGFKPSHIPGLLLWLDASQIVGLNDGDAVATWPDLTGNGYNATQAVASRRPTYRVVSGLPVVETDGVDDRLLTSGLDLSATNSTVIWGAKYVTATTGRSLSGRANNWLLGHYNGGTKNYFAEGWVAGPSGSPSDTNWRIYAGTADVAGDSWAFYVNGALDAGPNNAGSQGPNDLCIGCFYDLSEFANMQASFLFVYNRVLTGAEIQTIYDNMRGRLGL